MVLAVPLVALAHTGVASTTPGDGETLDDPVTEVVVVFTEPVTPVGNGFEILDPEGNVVVPEVETADDITFHLVPEEPLAGGEVGVRFDVASVDGHVVSEAFSFTVTAPAPTTTTTTRATTTSAADNPPEETTIPALDTTIPASTTVPSDVANSTTAPVFIAVAAAAIAGVIIWLVVRSRRGD